MQFFEINCRWDKAVEEYKKNERRRLNRSDDLGCELSELCDKFNEKIKDTGILFVSNINYGYVTLGLFLREKTNADSIVKTFSRMMKLNLYDIKSKEVVTSHMMRLLAQAEGFDYNFDKDEVTERIGISDISEIICRRYIEYQEKLIKPETKEQLYEDVDNTYSVSTLKPELDRIYATSHKRYYGHPVNYIIESDSKDIREKIIGVLLGGLYNNNRIGSRRYGLLQFELRGRLDRNDLVSIARSNYGGSMIWDCVGLSAEDEEFAYGSEDIINNISFALKNTTNKVLHILFLPRNSRKIKEKLFEKLDGITFVELKEDFSYYEGSCNYLKMLASKKKVRTDKSLFSKIDESQGYLATELNMLFDKWYSSKLKRTVFPQYSNIKAVKSADIISKPKGRAINELEEMVGILSAKSVINDAISYYKAQKIFKDKGMQSGKPAMHMVFTGNPGTAKTTVARLVARIFKENDIIQSGRIVECGRGDLVGRYVGWTAPTIQKKFKEAEGGVLFIDEAYSLVDDRDGMFGDEAINTIVQEMENHRKDVIVIFAGYPDKMQGFLDKNPGLRSRIAFHVNFEDYSTNELCDIASLMAKKMDMTISKEAMDKLSLLFDKARLEDDYGNGRYVRNALERARMAQSSRLIKMDIEKIKKKDLQLILPEDITEPMLEKKTEVRKIGFQL